LARHARAHRRENPWADAHGIRYAPTRCDRRARTGGWPLLLRRRPRSRAGFRGAISYRRRLVRRTVRAIGARRRAALASLADDDAAGARASAAARAARPARLESLAIDRCRRARKTDRRERPVHRVPHGPAVQLSPRRREDRTTDGRDRA